ncbi:hypothetical protein BO71DRAFT_78879 [Aspergillus ellipticus CBS 707.79]|uniref:Uncharacterized protein n=1 Tax=Aspergillus ellipticus CBS 707.79 TaxID=1448320 RepID=A0A319DN82_9EURO|nr:hypothetical protein BO71DRAFT_78879 [Aspergillus ellipticus CBS 707.79]
MQWSPTPGGAVRSKLRAGSLSLKHGPLVRHFRPLSVPEKKKASPKPLTGPRDARDSLGPRQQSTCGARLWGLGRTGCFHSVPRPCTSGSHAIPGW